MKDAEKCLLKIIIEKISRNEALKLYNSLIKPDVDMLNNALSRGKNSRNILAILDNIKSSLFDVYFHYQDRSSETEECIAERTKLRRQRSDEIKKKKRRQALNCLKDILIIWMQEVCTRLWMRQKTHKKTGYK